MSGKGIHHEGTKNAKQGIGSSPAAPPFVGFVSSLKEIDGKPNLMLLAIGFVVQAARCSMNESPGLPQSQPWPYLTP